MKSRKDRQRESNTSESGRKRGDRLKEGKYEMAVHKQKEEEEEDSESWMEAEYTGHQFELDTGSEYWKQEERE